MADDFAKQIASRLRELREQGGLSVRGLARRAGVLPEVVSRSERGVTEITLSTLAKVCAALDVPLPEFFNFAHAEKRKLRPGVQNLMGLLSAMPAARLDRIVRGLQLLLREDQAEKRRKKRSK